jgi:hypothetical protein
MLFITWIRGHSQGVASLSLQHGLWLDEIRWLLSPEG